MTPFTLILIYLGVVAFFIIYSAIGAALREKSPTAPTKTRFQQYIENETAAAQNKLLELPCDRTFVVKQGGRVLYFDTLAEKVAYLGGTKQDPQQHLRKIKTSTTKAAPVFLINPPE